MEAHPPCLALLLFSSAVPNQTLTLLARVHQHRTTTHHSEGVPPSFSMPSLQGRGFVVLASTNVFYPPDFLSQRRKGTSRGLTPPTNSLQAGDGFFGGGGLLVISRYSLLLFLFHQKSASRAAFSPKAEERNKAPFFSPSLNRFRICQRRAGARRRPSFPFSLAE